MAIGVDTLELDIGVTRDGVVVIAHDPYLNPAITRDGNGRWLAGTRGPLLRNLSYAEIQRFDVGRINPDSTYARTFSTQQGRDGIGIPRLADLFDRVKALGASHVRFNIETKINPTATDETVAPDVMVDALLAVIRSHAMESRVSIQSFDWRTLRRVQQQAPGIPTVFLTIQTANNDSVAREPGTWTAGLRLADHGSVPKLVKAAGGAVWSPNGGALNQALVQEAQALGLKVIPWTINNPADMERLLTWGVDGIITDYPDRLREVMRQRGMSLPRPHAP